MRRKPVNAEKGKQGFQPTTRGERAPQPSQLNQGVQEINPPTPDYDSMLETLHTRQGNTSNYTIQHREAEAPEIHLIEQRRREQAHELLDAHKTQTTQHQQAHADLLIEGYSPEELTDNPDIVTRRIEQQTLIANIPGIVQLDAPGAHADSYDLDDTGRPRTVYYASFGSNLFADRFNAYIAGGQPEGATRAYHGCRDSTPPSDDIPVALNGTVHYAGESLVWTGGVAFLDTQTQGKSLGRAYRITADQFDDVVAQECNETPGSRTLNLPQLLENGRHVEPGNYGALVHVGDYDNAPVFTFTGPFTTRQARAGTHTINPDGHLVHAQDPQAAPTERKKAPWPVFTNPPSQAYQDKIAAGLAETFNLTAAQAHTYFAGSTGYQHH